MTSTLFHGFILSLGLIIPLGVQNMFIFSQGAVSKKFRYVLPIVITAAICDSLLILFAVLGVSVIVFSFLWMKTVLIVFGSLFLIYMGLITWKAKTESNPEQVKDSGMNTSKVVSYTIMISILNPHAILDTVGVIGTNSLNYQGYSKFIFTCACILISWAWFFLLALLGHYVGSKDKSGYFTGYINKISAVIMWGVSIYLISSL
ncbi:LysE/ArgO family amino acid transporter [Cohnella sp. WQ 127256]|uniref:LysE/ArgO family amino acid transporter n=1 Tax=Cohnella sp. WQ 127256 TaxID=2938790 RepID=UPI0021173956|nr:LysE family transporter [Cohnella sp. WQ 127256]